MTDQTLLASAYSIQAAKPSLKYGQLAVLPVQATASAALFRVSLAKVPSSAQVTSATLQVATTAAASGSIPLNCYEVGSAWSSSVTWNNRPTFPTMLDSATLSSPAAGTVVSFDVTAAVQRIVAGTDTDYGFQVSSTSSTMLRLAGAGASDSAPVLLLSYGVGPDVPSGLHPSSGLVSVAKPTLSFDGDDDMIALQVQIDTPPGDSSPLWDSGTVTATAGLLDLSTTSYGGLSDGTVRVWRARQKNALGWSDWSSWVSLARSAKAVLAITSPASASVSDGTPPVEWTFGGTQVAWQATFTDAVTGKVLASSGKTVGADTDWTPSTGLTRDGQSGVITVKVWDDVDRSSTAGDDVTVSKSLTVTLNLDDTVTPMDSVDVTQIPPAPGVRVAGIRSEGASDQVALFRSVNGEQEKMVGRWDGADVFTGDYLAVWDYTAPMNYPVSYRVAPGTLVGSSYHFASGGSAETYYPTCAGVWLIDEADTTQQVCVVGTADGQQATVNQSSPEQTIVHTPVSSDQPLEMVVRRLASYPDQGDVAGGLIDALGVSAMDSEAALRGFKANDPSHTYRLVFGRQNLRVRLTAIEVGETPYDSSSDRIVSAAFSWYATADQT